MLAYLSDPAHAGTILACSIILGFLSLCHSELNRKLYP